MLTSESGSWWKNIINQIFLLCDVHGAMQNETEFMRPGLSVPDGVHFTKEGDRVCGETFGQTIFQYLQTMHSNET